MAVFTGLGSAAAPSITFSADTNTGVFSPGADQVAVATNGVERVEFGTAEVVFNDGGENYNFRVEGDTNANLLFVDASTDRVGIGVTSPAVQLTVNANSAGTIVDSAYFCNAAGAASAGQGSRILLGGFLNNTTRCAAIEAAISDGLNGHHLAFLTQTAGSAPTERMRIKASGGVFFNTFIGAESETNSWFIVNGASSNQGFSAYGYQAVAGNINRSNDGDLLNFRSAGITEGTISVSGTTVSYNGAHLSRWSQLLSGAERIEILRGSVLSNLDEMCEWGEEDNEQLNRMKVSDVEGDKNISGVFQCWDDDDDTYTNDFYCAMTGDFVIRIAEGVTVERGDLLMSAGDGTAKPQDDDIIRSKTIAKVTSTNVSCTYEDGSYCVPCVLMAC